MVLHLWTAATPSLHASVPVVPRVGFVVSKAVGPAVTRNLVKRRLRHLARERVDQLPTGSMLVVRALPAAAEATYEELGAELDRCLTQVVAKLTLTNLPAKAVISR
jgi:ribonuclease P protein component